MHRGFRLFPEQASSLAEKVDRLYAFEVGVALFFTALICALILFFGIKYRRGSRADRGSLKSRNRAAQSNLLEVAWAIVPLLLSMVMFGWGAWLYFEQKTVPAAEKGEPEPLEVQVVGKQWMWKIAHPSGRREINELHVPVDQVVLLRMTSDDVIHSFFVPDFRVKQDVVPGMYTTLWFKATKRGRFRFFCAEYCGTEHSKMIGEVIVQSPTEYAAWVSGDTGEPQEVRGRKLFERHRCGSCHKPGSTRAPSLVGLFGNERPLEGGETVTADENYVSESILQPAAKVVAGYEPLMPIYDLNAGEVMQLMSYIKSWDANSTPAAASSRGAGDETDEP